MNPDEALAQAVRSGDLPAVKAALQAGAGPDGPPRARVLPLTDAVIYSHAAVARELLRAGASLAKFQVNWRRQGGDLDERSVATLNVLGAAGLNVATPLLLAALDADDVATARAAIAQGADVNGGRRHDEGPLELALDGGHVALANELLAAGARLRPGREHAAFVLECAIRDHGGKGVRAALSAGVDPRVHNDQGENGLMWAAQAGDAALVQFFLQHGLDPRIPAKESAKSLLDYAREGGNAAVIARCEKLGIVSRRDQALAVGKALQREFGGRMKPERQGGDLPYFLVPRIPGFGKVDIEFGPDAWQINCEQFSSPLPGLGPKSPAWFAVNRTKPVGFLLKPKPVRARGVFARYDVPVSRGDRTPLALVKKFCRANEATIVELGLRDGEFLFVGYGRLVLRAQAGDLALARQRIAILRRLFAGNSRAPEPERALFAREVLLKPAPRGAATRARMKHRCGGAHAGAPACVSCGAAEQLMAELDLRDGVLGKTKLRRATLPVFWCLECGDWDPVFHDLSGERITTLDRKGKPLPAPKAASAADLRERPMTLVPLVAGKRAGSVRGAKAGGAPAWLQSPEVPECVRCRAPMAFALQLPSDRSISFGDVRTLYAFVCPACQVSATLVQSH